MTMIAVGTVFLFSLVQSLFGMGLLIFGTPTLLLAGFSFTETLATLLPASIIISFLQLLENWRVERSLVRQFLLWCLPPLCIGLVVVIRYDNTIALELVLGILMLLFALNQLFPRFAQTARTIVQNNTRACLIVMGAVHGISNLGGSILSIFASANSETKVETRRTIAFFYLCFAFVQLTILAILQPEVFSWNHAFFSLLAGVIYLVIGRQTFESMTQFAYDKLFIAFMFAYAIVLCSRGLGVV